MRSLRSVAMIRFAKYHGCGNDFIILKEEDIPDRDYAGLARGICHRQLGVGADGLIIVRQNPLEMVFYNSDGSRAPMCGNGIRCFAKYCFDEDICTDEEYPVATLAGTMGVRITGKDPFLVEIDMGKPDFDPKRCEIATDLERFLGQKLRLRNGEIEVSSCFMGTVHTVVWLDQQEASGLKYTAEDGLDAAGLTALGEEISNHPMFKEKTNVNFVRIIDHKTLELTTYERGAGMTFACGTGACASVVIGSQEDRCDRDARVILPYGELFIAQKKDRTVMMTGPAVKIARGYYEG